MDYHNISYNTVLQKKNLAFPLLIWCWISSSPILLFSNSTCIASVESFTWSLPFQDGSPACESLSVDSIPNFLSWLICMHKIEDGSLARIVLLDNAKMTTSRQKFCLETFQLPCFKQQTVHYKNNWSNSNPEFKNCIQPGCLWSWKGYVNTLA